MNFSKLRRTATLSITIAAGAASIYLATLPNPTQPQKDLGNTTNRIFLLGSRSLLKEPKCKDKDQNHKNDES